MILSQLTNFSLRALVLRIDSRAAAFFLALIFSFVAPLSVAEQNPLEFSQSDNIFARKDWYGGMHIGSKDHAYDIRYQEEDATTTYTKTTNHDDGHTQFSIVIGKYFEQVPWLRGYGEFATGGKDDIVLDLPGTGMMLPVQVFTGMEGIFGLEGLLTLSRFQLGGGIFASAQKLSFKNKSNNADFDDQLPDTIEIGYGASAFANFLFFRGKEGDVFFEVGMRKWLDDPSITMSFETDVLSVATQNEFTYNRTAQDYGYAAIIYRFRSNF